MGKMRAEAKNGEGNDGEEIDDDAFMPFLKESEPNDVFSEYVNTPSYSLSSIPKQRSQQEGTPLPEAMQARAQGPGMSPSMGSTVNKTLEEGKC